MCIFKKLWIDEAGSADYLFLVLMLTVCVLGIVPGLATVRDHVVQQFGDLAVAFDSLDQSYSVNVNGVISEYADDPPALDDPVDAEPACISVVDAPASAEQP